MKNELKKLLKIKSIITLSFTILFFILAIRNKIPVDKVCEFYMLIIAFYFGSQSEKKENREEE